MSTHRTMETFAEFKKSFFYGRRADLNFKFLAELSDEQAARFFQELLRKLGEAIDTGRFDPLIDHVYRWQIKAYEGDEKWRYSSGPFTPLCKPISKSRLALLSSSGHFVAGEDPEPFGVPNMNQEEAMARIGEFLKSEPQLSPVAVNTPKENLRVRHGGYDIHGARVDPNVVFPYEILKELQGEGRIGEVAEFAYSFGGACSQRLLLERAAPHWLDEFRAQRVDAVLLVPV